MKKIVLLLVVLAMLAGRIEARIAQAQMMGDGDMGGMMSGGDMGGMMGGGDQHARSAVMSWMSGAELKVTPSEPAPKFDTELRSTGARLYSEHCAICHGAKGDGHGLRATGLAPPPRNFTKGVFAYRSTPSGTLPTDEDIWKVISNGLHGTAMVPWVSLREHGRWALVSYIETFSPRFATEARGVTVTVSAAPEVTPELVAKGEALYLSDCSSCHGAKGHGDGPAVMKAAEQEMRPRDFTGGVFERGSSLEDIYLTVNTGLNGTPMSSFDKALSPDQTWAVAAYVRSLISRRPHQHSGMMGMMSGANDQERRGMMIDMPGMTGMGMGMHGH
jgi:mono/diheme cytochrome c family protein